MSFLTAENLEGVTGGRWLVRPSPGIVARGIGTDTRGDLRGCVFLALKGDRHDGHAFLQQAVDAGACMLIVEREPERSLHNVATLLVPSTRAALIGLARAYRDALEHPRIIGITGSAGKTTTKHLLNTVLSSCFTGTCAVKSFNNDIGLPLTILSARPDDAYLTLELGTNEPGEIANLASIARPGIGIITSIGRSHLEGLGSVDGVAREKSALLHQLPADGLAIVPSPCDPLEPYLADVKCRLIRVGGGRDADVCITRRGRARGGRGEGWWFEVDGSQRFTLTFPGSHNATNALICIVVARQFGMGDDEIKRALMKAQPADMRMTRVEIAGMTFFNDAYNANPDSMMASLAAFAEAAPQESRRVVILGDMLELGPESEALHDEIGQFIATESEHLRIGAIVAVGSTASRYLHSASEVIKRSNSLAVEGLDDHRSIDRILEFLRSGDAVLVKGSRRMGLERIIEAVRVAHTAGTPSPQLSTA